MRCLKLTLAFLVAFSLSILYAHTCLAANKCWNWSPDVGFGLPAYNATVRFDDWIELNNFTWNEANASEIIFRALKKPSYILNKPYNLTLDYNITGCSLLVNSTGFQDKSFVVGTETLMLNMRYEAVRNGSITAQDQNDALRRLYATISDISGKAQVQVYTNDYRPRYVKVGGSYLPRSEWTYDSATKILTFNVTAASPRDVEPIFGITDEEATGGTIAAGIMGFLTKFRKKIANLHKKHREWIERGLVLALILTFIILAVWISGIYMGLW